MPEKNTLVRVPFDPKAEVSTRVTELGMTTPVRRLPWKELEPIIERTLFALNVTEVSLLDEKAKPPIRLTELGITT